MSAPAHATASLPLPLPEPVQLVRSACEPEQHPPVFSAPTWREQEHRHVQDTQRREAYHRALLRRALDECRLPCPTHGDGNRARLLRRDICWGCYVDLHTTIHEPEAGESARAATAELPQREAGVASPAQATAPSARGDDPSAFQRTARSWRKRE
jgi:hypothetical protein